MTALSSRELMDAVKEVRPHVEALTNEYREAAVAFLTAERIYKLAEARAFLDAKKEGATDEMAKRIAVLNTTEEKKVLDEALAIKQASKLGGDAWQRVLETYSALSNVLNRELRTFSYGNAS